MTVTDKKDCTIYRFTVKVNYPNPYDFNTCLSAENAGEEYEDCGFLIMPRNASKPTRLIISCHGAGGTVETDDSQIERQTLTKYLVSNGYAVMDVNGLPARLAAEKGIDIRNNIGCYLALQSYVNAYRFVMSGFDLKKDVLVMGASMGGISSTNLVLCGQVSVIAQAGFCPVLDTYSQIFLHPWCSGLPRDALGLLYELDKDDHGQYVYNEQKIRGFNPMGRLVQGGSGELLDYPVPVKFWQCEDDGTVSIETTKRFAAAVANAGGTAILRTFPSGGHEPQDAGETIQSPKGICVFNGEILKIKPAVEEVYLWFRSFE